MSNVLWTTTLRPDIVKKSLTNAAIVTTSFPERKYNVLIFGDIKDVAKYWHLIKNTNVVICCALQEIEWITHANPFSKIGTNYKPVSCNRLMFADKFLENLIENIVKGSLLNRLMTAIYNIPKPATQKAVKMEIIHWLFEGQDWDLRASLSKHYSKIDSVLAVIKDPIMKPYLLAFSHIAKTYGKNVADLSTVKEKYGTDLFELNYCHRLWIKT